MRHERYNLDHTFIIYFEVLYASTIASPFRILRTRDVDLLRHYCLQKIGCGFMSEFISEFVFDDTVHVRVRFALEFISWQHTSFRVHRLF